MKKYEMLNLSASLLAMTIAVTLVGIKFIAWDATDSISILSSLVDSFLDVLISFITFLSIQASMVPADHDHRFGHGKYQAIAALAQAIIIFASVFFVIYQAIVRILTQAEVQQPDLGVTYMIVSLALTIILVLYQRFVAHKTQSIAIKADSMHYLSDIFTTLVVIISMLSSMYFKANQIDIILGILLMLIVLYGVKNILIQALAILTDRELNEDLRTLIKSTVLAHPKCLGMHDLRTRDSGSKKFIQFHMELDSALLLKEVHQIDDEISDAISELIPECEVIIHMDPKD
jgi:ferrous-iron efflux pump FieF